MSTLVRKCAALHELNRYPLNREAKRWLLQANDPPDEESPYLLQLLFWGLNEGNVSFGPKEEAQLLRLKLENAVNGLLSNPDPQAQWDWLTKEYHGHPDDPPYLNVQSLRNAQDPKDAAWRALDALASLLSADPRLSKDRMDE